jgi:predicted RNA polymerase sigma factor
VPLHHWKATTDRPVDDLLRRLAPQVLGTLMRRHGDFELCEDAVQEALLVASGLWADEVPDNPHGWLLAAGVTAAHRPVPQ